MLSGDPKKFVDGNVVLHCDSYASDHSCIQDIDIDAALFRNCVPEHRSIAGFAFVESFRK